MASGIDNSQCVVVFITKRYVDKVGGTNPEDNCQLEFNYAARRKGANKMIGVVMEKRMSDTSTWVGEVGLVLGGRLYADMTGEFNDSDYLERCADDLYNRIMKVIGKPVPSFNVSIDPHVHRATSNSSADPQASISIGGGGGGAGGGSGANELTNQSSPLKIQPTKATRPLNTLSIEEISSLLNNLNLGKFIANLKENEVDGATLAMCKTEEEIVEIGVSMQLKARVLFAKIQIYKIEGVPLTDLENEDKGNHQETPKNKSNTPKNEEPASQQNKQSTTTQSPTTVISTPSSSGASNPTSLESIGIHGTTGSCSIIDGIYEMTNETFGDMKRYKKKTADHWLEYHSSQKRWHCKPASKKGSTDAWAYMDSEPGILPFDSGHDWYVFDGSNFLIQQQISTYCAQPFRVYNSDISQLNGVYEPTYEMFSKVCRYQKSDKTDYWFEYNSSLKHWHITSNKDKGSTQAFAFAAATSSPPWKQKLSWQTYNGSSFNICKDMIIIPDPKPLEVKGGSGSTADYVAGIYDPTNEICDGWVRYRKRTDPDSWMEYMASQQQWHIKPTSSKGQTNAWVMAKTPLLDPSLFEGAWAVYNGTSFVSDSGLKIKRI